MLTGAGRQRTVKKNGHCRLTIRDTQHVALVQNVHQQRLLQHENVEGDDPVVQECHHNVDIVVVSDLNTGNIDETTVTHVLPRTPVDKRLDVFDELLKCRRSGGSADTELDLCNGVTCPGLVADVHGTQLCILVSEDLSMRAAEHGVVGVDRGDIHGLSVVYTNTITHIIRVG
ncbi:methylcrotonoyl carboxylase, putative [Babesia ovis]|uniref:Methylcrotonoyl carboxylase, putative n=1 Tax=Babesia ovis TaxID=5869 RepID=A0A9W5TDD2_BABOV|nr:methylcrotonoyl carboxylase, putative [Babesia ovis]